MSDTQDAPTQSWLPPQPQPQHDVVVTQDSPSGSNPLKAPLIVLAALAGVMAVTAAALGLLFVGERSDHADTRATLAEVRADVRETKADLDAALDKVSGLTSEVSTLQSQLNGAIDRARSAEEETESIQATADDLRECLSGVLEALDYSLDQDYLSGAAELRAVRTVCQRAGDALDAQNI
jgi:ABC-type transporter Mla subunit MlaD